MSSLSPRVHRVALPLLLGLTACTGSSGAPAPATPVPVATGTEPVAVAAGARSRNPIATVLVKKEHLRSELQIGGSVALDQDHYAVVGPLVVGRVARLRVSVGDKVRAGQILAEIESADIGQAQAAYLSARARGGAAEANLARERELTAQRISSVREREVAEAQALSDRADLNAATERLRAFGLSEREIKALDGGTGTGGRVTLRAPIDGTVVERLVTLGQAVERADDAFKIVNLEHLWVLLDVYEKDLGRVHIGQKVNLRTEARPGEVFKGGVAYINPLIDEKTRTAHVRLELDNPDGKLIPGQFVSARLMGGAAEDGQVEVLVVPRQAVQSIDGKSLVFVRRGAGFERRVVELGASAGELVEVRAGLEVGEVVATEGAFLLKSELLR